MAEAILLIYNDILLRMRLGANGRKYAVQHFSRRVVTLQYVQLLQEVLCPTF
jgi:glycosyltransferase involved in cell wall biosynthesis